MHIVRILALALALSACATTPESAQPSPVAATTEVPPHAPVSLDFLAGDWVIHDQTGALVGSATILLQAPGAMLFEQRTVARDAPQPLWFVHAERTGGWVQLFLNPGGQVREFTTESTNGNWPLVLGAQVRLRDGALARFRLTMTRASDNESRRLLEMSRDGGTSWSAVFDYTYRRTGS